jgi:hypothetical protein
MSRLILPLMLLVSMCTAGCINTGGDDRLPNFPFTRTLSVTFVNNGTTPVHMWLNPDTARPETLVQPGQTRTETVTRTWENQGDVETFNFVARFMNIDHPNTINVAGRDSNAPNFSGFRATFTDQNFSTVTE